MQPFCTNFSNSFKINKIQTLPYATIKMRNLSKQKIKKKKQQLSASMTGFSYLKVLENNLGKIDNIYMLGISHYNFISY